MSLDAHLRACPSLHRRCPRTRAIQAGSQDGREALCPSAEFRAKLQKAVAPQRRWNWNFGWKLATAALALALFAGAVTTYAGRESLRRQHFYTELADLHVATLGSVNPVDVISTDRHTVKPWFQGKIPFSFNLPELQNTDFALIGGRVTYVGQQSGAHLDLPGPQT